MVKAYRTAGVRSFFHLPVVLFGERTALPGDWGIGHFYPKSRALKVGEPVILDASPIFDGYMVDTSFSFAVGHNAAHRAMMLDLAEFRRSVLDAVNAGDRFKVIADRVNARIAAMGYEPVHGKHPGEVLGHRALRLPNFPFDWRFKGFDALSLGWFILKGKLAQTGLGRHAPTWNTSAQSDHAPHDGLWLVEPHAGKNGVGAKWEEILVIQGGRAAWLDDDVPHLRQWAMANGGGEYGPVAVAATMG
ncbi:MAG: aminopeptidase P family protein [Sphingomonas sp.]|nr:aminopeptidase P family protein [Sphingomonas sp.]